MTPPELPDEPADDAGVSALAGSRASSEIDA
jgi:hypothetical protein